MVDLNDLHIFVQAVEQGGFAAAGRHLRKPKSTVSKRVSELEANLGARLIRRTTRSFALTDTGCDFYEHARAALIEAESAESVVRRRLAEPSGTVRLTTSIPTAQFYLADHLPRWHALIPRCNCWCTRPIASWIWCRKASTSPFAVTSRRCPIPRSCNGVSLGRRWC